MTQNKLNAAEKARNQEIMDREQANWDHFNGPWFYLTKSRNVSMMLVAFPSKHGFITATTRRTQTQPQWTIQQSQWAKVPTQLKATIFLRGYTPYNPAPAERDLYMKSLAKALSNVNESIERTLFDIQYSADMVVEKGGLSYV